MTKKSFIVDFSARPKTIPLKLRAPSFYESSINPKKLELKTKSVPLFKNMRGRNASRPMTCEPHEKRFKSMNLWPNI